VFSKAQGQLTNITNPNMSLSLLAHCYWNSSIYLQCVYFLQSGSGALSLL